MNNRALHAYTTVTPQHGQWAVDITITFPDTIVHHRINTYYTRERATYAANVIERCANRW